MDAMISLMMIMMAQYDKLSVVMNNMLVSFWTYFNLFYPDLDGKARAINAFFPISSTLIALALPLGIII